MDVRELLEAARDTLTVKRVFGEPYESNGRTVIPVARVQGGGGGGQGQSGEGESGGGGGFGLSAHAAGVYVVTGQKVTWVPAVDINRIVLGGQVVAVVALLTLRTIIKSRQKTARRRS